MKIIDAPQKATFDFITDGRPIYVIGGKPLVKISERGKADKWEEIPLAKFSSSQQAEIQRLAKWRALPRSNREQIVNQRLAKMVAFSL